MSNGRAASALQGAAAGASLGTAINPGIGTAVGAGVGLLGGALMYEGESEYEKYTAEQLKELKRRQELGMLGLTSEEEAALRSQYQGSIAAARRESQEALRAAGTQMDPSAFARQGAAAEAEVARQSVEAETAISEADLQKRAMEEQKLMELLAVQYDLEYQRSQDMWSGAAGLVSGLAMAGIDAGAESESAELTGAALAAKYGLNPADSDEVLSLATEWGF
tara:strand:+ start:148 stop:813 length:666 start_codon:yes stop_codon:yes gene_type:complete